MRKWVVAIGCAGLASGFGMEVTNSPSTSDLTQTNETWSLHFQATTVSQAHNEFHSPYSGKNSLQADEPWRSTLTATLFLGARLWPGAEVHVNPEIAGGKGLSGTLGVAGFPNGEATRVGNPEPTPYFARYFLRQRFDLGGDAEQTEADENQLARFADKSNVTLTAGKVSAGDVFDDNKYTHDPRTQFMNWSLMFNGAWDYPADTRGYTYGFAVELNEPNWALRAGTFMEPTEANGARFDQNFGKASGNVLELEKSFCLFGRPGKARAIGFINFARMGSYRQATENPAAGLDIAQTREYRQKFGFGLNLEHEVSDDVGVFARLGWNDGH